MFLRLKCISINFYIHIVIIVDIQIIQIQIYFKDLIGILENHIMGPFFLDGKLNNDIYSILGELK